MFISETDRTFPGSTLIVAFSGWVDAAGVGTGVAEHLAMGGDLVGHLDPDEIFDYRVNRPSVDFIDGKLQSVEYPEVTVRSVTFGDASLLVMTGTEPEFRWQGLGRAMVDLTNAWGVAELVCVGSVPAAVAHTRPTNVLSTSTTADFSAMGERVPEGLLRVPGAAVTSIEWHLAQAGMPTYGFWAQVPHYVGDRFKQGVVALVERVARHLDVEVPLRGLLEEAIEQRDRLDRLVAANPEVSEFLNQLESLVDPDDLPSAEEIATEIEDFLKGTGE